MRALAAVAAAVALGAPGHAWAARYAVGLQPGANADAVATRLADATGGTVSRELVELGALTLDAPSARSAARTKGVAYVERVDRRRRLAFTPTDPLAPQQWHLVQTRAFDAWLELPPLAPVRVAIIDSGIDANHPEFEGRIAAGRSFVGGDWRTDQQGHGTFVAGIVAANLNNGIGIAGMAFPAELLVAKVVRADRSISLEAEARAIRWAIEQNAQVINLSLGGLRDPFQPQRDTFSPLEAAAVAYASRSGAVLVAAVGNADQAPRRPWPFASYPAALPHVLGVSALARDGSVPTFSDRDPIFNDLAAPGQDILSTLPLQLTEGCKPEGYSVCGPDEFRRAEGTSFAAPQAAAAAALLLGVDPSLAPDQVTAILTRSAEDANVLNGCRQCRTERDELSGWGRLDVAAAVARAEKRLRPPADRFETNDDAGTQAFRVYGRRGNAVQATLDYWDDQTDVYSVLLRSGQRIAATLAGQPGSRVFLWKPGTQRVEALSVAVQRQRVAQSVRRGSVQRFAYRVPARRGGWYYLQVKATQPGSGPYTLRFTKR